MIIIDTQYLILKHFKFQKTYNFKITFENYQLYKKHETQKCTWKHGK